VYLKSLCSRHDDPIAPSALRQMYCSFSTLISFYFIFAENVLLKHRFCIRYICRMEPEPSHCRPVRELLTYKQPFIRNMQICLWPMSGLNFTFLALMAHYRCFLTYSWCWALLEKLPIVQPLKNFPTFYGTRKFITAYTRALHWSLS
jgi:hypothetical protein